MAKIMLVEDDNNLREIYGARLLAEGHEIVSAKDGEEALAIAVKEKPELIISDVMMPKISGFDMLDILRNAPETKYTKVIMMTALSQAEDKARADNLGADRYLVKSQVTLEDVARAVRDVLDGKTASESETVPITPDTETPQAPATEPSAQASVATPEPNASAEPTTPIEQPPVASPEAPAEIAFPQIPITPPGNTQVASPPAPEAPTNSTESNREIISPSEPVAPVGFTPPTTPDPTVTPQVQPDDQSSVITPTASDPAVTTPEPASKIEVTLPNIEEKTEEVAPPVVVQPEPADDSKDAQIGENLNDIMKKELESGETPPSTATAEAPATPEAITPDATSTPEHESPSQPAPVEDKAEEDSNHKKIVIQPINDLSKPKLDAEAAKEEPGVGSVANATVQPTVVAPSSAENSTPQPPAQPAQPTEHDIISL